MSGRGDAKECLSGFDGRRENVEAKLRDRNGKVSDTAENEDASAAHSNYDHSTVYHLEEDDLKS